MSIVGRVVPGPLKRLARTWINHLAFERKLRLATPVLIYQMSKVGSLSVHVSLQQQYHGAVVHTHHFGAYHPDPQVRRLHRWTFAESRPINVISLTREPVSRNVSAFFQCFEQMTGSPYSEAQFSLDELKAIFLTKYWHDHPAGWFDKHIRGNLGIDVFAKPFPGEGFSMHEQGNVRLLVIRSEIDDAAKVRAICDFLDLPALQLSNTNIGDEKDYAATYKAFKRDVKLPIEYVERMCASNYFQHFYDETTKVAVLAKWCDPGQNG